MNLSFLRFVKNTSFSVRATALVLSFAIGASAATLTVGPKGVYKTPCKAIAAAAAGDTIQVDAAGSYNGDVCHWPTNNLTIQGVNGRPHIDAAGHNSEAKAIWVIDGANTTIENMEFSGTRNSSLNGAAIRFEGVGLTIRNCYFHDNQEGILTNRDNIGDIVIEYSEFGYNGAGDGYSHNMYINHAEHFTLRYCYSHHANVGHLVKSRAKVNYILYNRIGDEASGNASYELDLPSGGTSYVIGNVIEQGPNSPNPTIMSYQEEANNGNNYVNPGGDLYVINNTFVNEQSIGTFIVVDPSVTIPAVIQNNIFSGPGTITTQPNAMLSGNVTVDPQFVNANLYDYRLRAGSPAINAGRTPGTSPEGYSLVPSNEYVHGSCTATRTQSGAMDAGAHEFGNNAAPQCSSYDPTIALTPSVTLAQSSVVAGNTVMATVMLSKPAPPNGAPVTFEVNGSAVTAASTVTVPAGGTYITAPLATTWISSTTPVTVMAMVQGKSGSAAMTVTPAPANLVDFSNTNPSTNTFTVSLSGPAPAGGAVVQLSVDNPAAAYVQPTVTVPAGTLTASVQTFGGVIDVATTVTVTASYSGVQMSDTMIAPVPTLSWIGVGAPTIPSGSNRTGNIYLMNSAPYGGALIQLTSSSPSFVVPATMLVPQGSLNVLFPVSSNTVTANTSVVVTATYNGAVATVPVTVTP